MGEIPGRRRGRIWRLADAVDDPVRGRHRRGGRRYCDEACGRRNRGTGTQRFTGAVTVAVRSVVMVGRGLPVIMALHDGSGVQVPGQDTDVSHDGRQCDESERHPEDEAYVTHETGQGYPPCRDRVNVRLTR